MIDSKYNLKGLINDLNGRRKTALFVGAGINMSKICPRTLKSHGMR